MKYKECYAQGVRELEKAMVPEAKLDARLLLEAICGTDRNTLLVHGDREVLPEQIESYEEAICKRAKRVPLQHILGQQEFMSLVFEVNEHVLIPRQDTEVLVERVLEVLRPPMNVLDMCTGSGCILISLLKMCPGVYGVGVDISKEALAVASRNGETILGGGTAGQVGEKVRWIHSDMFTQVEGEFDVITSNPPYIPTKVIEELMPEVKEFEPMNALDGMEDGLFFYRQIAEQAPKFLKSQGHLFLEIGYDQGESVSQLLTQQGFGRVEVIKDYAGLDRVVHAQK